jgi:putative lipoprotein
MFRKSVVLAASLALVNLGQLGWGQSEEPAVTGTVAYLQRSALPADAVVNVQLQDVSVQDAPAKIVAEVKIPAEGKQVPIAFRIPYAYRIHTGRLRDYRNH